MFNQLVVHQKQGQGLESDNRKLESCWNQDRNFQLKADLLVTTLSIVSDGEDLWLSYLVKYIVKVSDYVWYIIKL